MKTAAKPPYPDGKSEQDAEAIWCQAEKRREIYEQYGEKLCLTLPLVDRLCREYGIDEVDLACQGLSRVWTARKTEVVLTDMLRSKEWKIVVGENGIELYITF